MVFSSQLFLFTFLPLALLIYYAAPRILKQLALTVLSYVFYGWSNPWLVILIFASSIIDYSCGRAIAAEGASSRQRKAGLWISVASNLSLLAFFKYAGFFASSVESVIAFSGNNDPAFPAWLYTIPLPIGISFYTFQSMSYSIDLYRGNAKPARSFVDFLCYVAMFPQLVAGPIVRYSQVADQLHNRAHTLEGFVLGFTRFNIGFAKKILLANPMGAIADACFSAGDGSLGLFAAWLGVTAFAFQIYFDFSGYSDMALGLGRMFGFRLPENFDAPYRARSITEFWRRWHISLSTFLRDYLYIPLGGNRLSPSRTYANLMIVMFLGGLWHGAQWTFVIWGLIHGALLTMERWLGKKAWYHRFPGPARIALTFLILLITWVFFRAQSFGVAFAYLKSMFALNELAPSHQLLEASLLRPFNLIQLALCAITVWALPRTQHFLRELSLWKVVAGLCLFVVSVAMMLTQGYNPFLYFQF